MLKRYTKCEMPVIVHLWAMLVTIVLQRLHPRKFSWIPKIRANIVGTKKTWLPVGVPFSAGASTLLQQIAFGCLKANRRNWIILVAFKKFKRELEFFPCALKLNHFLK